MEFALNEILTIIDKVKSTNLALFEYQDDDTKIRIKGTRRAGQKTDRHDMAGAVQASAGSAFKLQAEGQDSAPEQLQNNPGTDQPPVNAEAASAGAQSMRVPAAEAQPKAGIGEKCRTITSPMVGTFYAAPSEKEEPFVHVGDRVKKGQTIGIVEAMKLMNEIESEWEGTVTEILVKNEQMVEYGQPLVRIEERQAE